MDKKRDLTKELLADCLKELVLTNSFEKITIKMVTDKAGLIRPTFYKHFQDKYEVLEWIFEVDIARKTAALLNEGKADEALLFLFTSLENERRFYRRCCLMEESPNSFRSILGRFLNGMFLDAEKRVRKTAAPANPILTPEWTADFYSTGLTHVICSWLLMDEEHSAKDLAAAYSYIVTHSISDLYSSSPDGSR